MPLCRAGGKDPTLDCYPEMARVFCTTLESAILDLKSLVGTDPLFRYEVTRDGILLYYE